MEWPGNSPDLNPIENLWGIMKKKIVQQKPSSLHVLKTSLLNVWEHDIFQDLLENLVDSMPKRVKMVIKNKGGPLKY